ncbi:MAG: YgjP-like metallopeptidase domain-containing protein, partial [Pseudomonadota bacterium]|nr:YgjP-like metallopeptidase domain-containing protein [Pseudomonadota bacterium]
MKSFILYGDERIEFACIPRKKVSSRILIKVHSDCRVVVHVPAEAPVDDVYNAVKKRARWIHTQLKDFREQLDHLVPRQYCSGESHYYLGKQYMLKVVESL